MKCKRIFALVLSLCLVLSTFVAVSAQEKVYDEGTVKTIVDMSIDADDPAFLFGTGFEATPALVDDPKDEKTGKVLGGKVTNTSYGYIGFELLGPDGMPVALKKGDIVELKAEIWHETGFTTGDSASTTGVILRAGDVWAPGGTRVMAAPVKKAVPAETWTPLDNTYTVEKDVGAKGVWLQVRPDKTGTFYIDNVSIKITGAREIVASLNATMDNEATGVLTKNSTVNYTTNPGKATVTMTGTGNNDMVGLKLVDKNGSPVSSIKSGDIIRWSVDINLTKGLSKFSGGTARGIYLRCGGATYPPTSTAQVINRITDSIPANQTTTLMGSYVAGQDYSSTGIYLNIRPELADTMVLDNFKIEVSRAAVKRDAGWVNPDYSIDFATSTTGNAGNAGITGSGDSYVADMAKVSKVEVSSTNDSTPWIRITPEKPLSLDDDWAFTFNITASGVTDPDGITSTGVRLFNSKTGDNNDYTIGYLRNVAAETTDGTVTITVNSTNFSKEGKGSETDAIESFCIVYNFGGMHKGDGTATGTVTFSDFNLVSKRNLSFEAAMDEGQPQLTITNGTADKYKFTGRILVAEYETVEGVEQLKKFKEVGNVEKEIVAGDSTVIDCSFANGTPSGKVMIFVWETGSMVPAMRVFTTNN